MAVTPHSRMLERRRLIVSHFVQALESARARLQEVSLESQLQIRELEVKVAELERQPRSECALASVKDAIGNTPLVNLSRLLAAEGVQGNLLMKLEYLNPVCVTFPRALVIMGCPF